jgi:hypothetical protein
MPKYRYTTSKIKELESKYAQLESKVLGNEIANELNP